MKKDFQKTIATIRKDIGACEYPKAMMTPKQIRNRTATVNCGGEWHGGVYSRNIADKVMEHPAFSAFLLKWNGKAELEPVRGFVQIRIYF